MPTEGATEGAMPRYAVFLDPPQRKERFKPQLLLARAPSPVLVHFEKSLSMTPVLTATLMRNGNTVSVRQETRDSFLL